MKNEVGIDVVRRLRALADAIEAHGQSTGDFNLEFVYDRSGAGLFGLPVRPYLPKLVGTRLTVFLETMPHE